MKNPMLRGIHFIYCLGFLLACSQKEEPRFQKNGLETPDGYSVKELMASNVIEDSVFTISAGESLNLFPKNHPMLDSIVLAVEDPEVIKLESHRVLALKEGYSKIYCYDRFSQKEPWFFIRIVVTQPDQSISTEIKDGKITPRRQSQPSQKEKDPPQPQKHMASLKVLSSPSYSQIYVDNVHWGTTPMLEAKALNPGSHQIMIIHRRYGQLDSLLQIAPGESHEVKFNFKN